MIGKVHQDSFPSLRIRIDEYDHYEPSLSSSGSLGSPVASPLGESLLPRDCHETLLHGFLAKTAGLQTSPTSSSLSSSSSTSSISSSPNSSCSKLTNDHHTHHQQQQQQQQQQQPSSRYKTEMCRPFQEHGECKYGEKCQFAHGGQELRTVNRHPKYKTDMCRTYHSVGFCPYGPRCHFIHALDELRPGPTTPEKKTNGAGNGANGAPIKQLPMFGGAGSGRASNNTTHTWSFNNNVDNTNNSTMNSDMRSAVSQLNNFFNVSAPGSRNSSSTTHHHNLNSSLSGGSSTSSRSGSFCSDLDSPSSTSPPPNAARLPIFSRLA